MRGGYELFRPFGVAVRLHPGFMLFLVVLAILSIAAGGEPSEVAQRLLAPAVLVMTVFLHEMGHALMARRVGLEVIDVVLTPLGGMARLQGLMEDPRKEILVAAAGPGTNLVLAAIVAGPAVALAPADEMTASHLFLVSQASVLDSHPLTMALSFNLLLGTLNLIPAFPMDGGRILRGVLTLKWGLLQATRIAFRLGTWFAILLIVLPFVTDVPTIPWWVLPIMGLYLLVSGARERIVVEAREGLGRMQGRIFTASFGDMKPGPFANPGEGPEPGVIDVSGEARIVDDDDDDDDDDDRRLPS